MNPKISIITVVRNGADDLRQTLTSLSSLEYDAKELIVIDGASTDETPLVIAEFAHHISYWISEPDQGLYDAMNKGIKAATGEYLWFVNAGDLPYSTDVLQQVFKPSEQYADIYFGDAMIITPKGEELGLRRKTLPNTLTANSLKCGMVVCHQAFIVRKNIAPLYDLTYRYVADIDWVIKSLETATSIQNAHAIICKFSIGGISTKHRRCSLIERFHVMRKHYGLCATLVAHVRFVVDLLVKQGYRPAKA